MKKKCNIFLFNLYDCSAAYDLSQASAISLSLLFLWIHQQPNIGSKDFVVNPHKNVLLVYLAKCSIWTEISPHIIAVKPAIHCNCFKVTSNFQSVKSSNIAAFRMWKWIELVSTIIDCTGVPLIAEPMTSPKPVSYQCHTTSPPALAPKKYTAILSWRWWRQTRSWHKDGAQPRWGIRCCRVLWPAFSS